MHIGSALELTLLDLGPAARRPQTGHSVCSLLNGGRGSCTGSPRVSTWLIYWAPTLVLTWGWASPAGQVFSKINLCVSRLNTVVFPPIVHWALSYQMKDLPHVGSFLWRTVNPLDPKQRPSFQGAAGMMLQNSIVRLRYGFLLSSFLRQPKCQSLFYQHQGAVGPNVLRPHTDHLRTGCMGMSVFTGIQGRPSRRQPFRFSLQCWLP